MMLIAKYRADFPSVERDREIERVVGPYRVGDGIEGGYRLLRFALPSREDAYYAAVLFDQEAPGVETDLAPIAVGHH